MAIYIIQDLETTDDGDLVIDSFGDLKVAAPMRTVAQCINNLLLTDRGDLRTEPNFGANIGTYIGSRNDKMTQRSMQLDIIEGADSQGAIRPSDLTVDVVPIDIDKVGIIAQVKGSYLYQLESKSTPLVSNATDGVTMAYVFPFNDGVLRRSDS